MTVTAEFEDGSTATGTTVIGADGVSEIYTKSYLAVLLSRSEMLHMFSCFRLCLLVLLPFIHVSVIFY